MDSSSFVDITSLEDTQKAAINLLSEVAPGSRIGLKGDLGLGKTTFFRFFLEAFCQKRNSPIPKRITSPSFTLHQNYIVDGIYVEHFDLYRLDCVNPAQLMGLGYPEACERIETTHGYLFVEWPERAGERLLDLNATLTFEPPQSKNRSLTVLRHTR